jgi:hypothetical protein
VGLLLDVALLALAVIVCGSLLLLAWTLAITGPESVRRDRAKVAVARERLSLAERRMAHEGEALRAGLRELSVRLKGDR